MSKPVNFTYSNTLINTQQPIVNQKKNSSPAVVPSNSRPNTNLGHAPQTSIQQNYDNARNYIGPFGRPYPIKHWRKQLNTNGSPGGSRTPIFNSEIPGGTVFRGYNKENDCKCLDTGNNKFITFNDKFLQSPYCSIKPPTIIPLSEGTVNNQIQNNGYIQVGQPDTSGSYQIQTGIYQTKNICSTPENQVIKSAVTLLSNSYYSNYSAYLRSKCVTYQQKASINPIPGVNYHHDLIAENPVQYLPNTCAKPYQTGKGCVVTTIYKPNNTQFATQGSVDSSLRTLKLNYDTVTKNASSFNTAFGAAAANDGRYRGEYNPSYFIKSKLSPPIAWRRNGDRFICKSGNKNCGPGQVLSSFWNTVN